MARRLAASAALVAFVVCILVGLQAENTFETIIAKALVAMGVTFLIGLVLGTMAQKMLDENLAVPNPSVVTEAKDLENPAIPQTKVRAGNR